MSLSVKILQDEDKSEGHLFSPSQLSTYLECPRKWAWRRIAKIYEPPAASAELGTRTHALLEKYLGEGVMPDQVSEPLAAKVASAGLHLLPAPKTEGMLLERKFRFQSTRTGFLYNGLKDVELEPGVCVPSLDVDGLVPVVVDHKTTSSISSYAKTADDLHYDPQAIIYAVDSMARFQASAADLRWIYYQTKGSHRASLTQTRVSAEHASSVFAALESVAQEAAAALDAKVEVLDLPPNPSACSAYGGCPHRHRCNLKPSDQARSHMSTSLISDLRKRVQSAVAVTVPVSEGVTATVIEAPKEEPAAINPPEQNLAPVPVEAKAEEVKEEKPKRKYTRRTEAKDPIGADAHAHTSDPVADAGIKAALQAEDVVESAGASKAEASGTIELLPKGFGLYVDCFPIGAPASMLAPFIAKANEDVEKVHGVPDYRLVDYGKGAPLFAASVLEQVLESGKDIILDTRTPEGAVVLEALTSKASFVVRGLR